MSSEIYAKNAKKTTFKATGGKPLAAKKSIEQCAKPMIKCIFVEMRVFSKARSSPTTKTRQPSAK
jgi:hypothetical protein